MHPPPKKQQPTSHEGEAYDIPEGGSHGLLALGYADLMMWRHERAYLEQARFTDQTTKMPPQSK